MKAIKTLFINPSIGFSPPFGLLYIAAMLEKHEYPVTIEELNTYGIDDYDFDPFVKEKIVGKVDVVGITCLTAYIKLVWQLIKVIKHYCPDIPIVVGGAHAIAMPEEMIEKGADIAVVGEGELVFLKILKNLEKGLPMEDVPSVVINQSSNGSIKPFHTPKSIDYIDVAKLPWPAYHMINMEHYVSNNYAIRGCWYRCGWIFTSRGCPAACTFCAAWINHGQRIRTRPVEDCIAELEYLKNEYGIDAFLILDDTFAVDRKRVLSFCDNLRQSTLHLDWAVQTRVNFFSEQVAQALKDSGCVQVDFGVESGSEKVLKAIKKNIKPAHTRKAFETAHKVDLRALATIMIGSPEETWEDIYLTKALLDDIKPDYTGVFFATPYPGTKLYDQAIENNWIDDPDNIEWNTEGHNDKPLMHINFTDEELYEIYDLLVSESFMETVMGYLSQKKFVMDILRIILFHPIHALRLGYILSSGDKQTFINTFRKLRIQGAFK